MIKRRELIKAGLAIGALSVSGEKTTAMDKQQLYIPPEEAPHELTFMQWPNSRKVYRDRYFLGVVQKTIADIANVISEFEPVIMLAPKSQFGAINRMISDRVELWDIPTEDLWCRDSGPLVAIQENGERAVSQIQFNGWGGKQVHEHDGKIAKRVAERLGLPVVRSGVIGEPGGVEHDGHGLLMAHESSWVNENRNPGLSRSEIESRLLDAYGADRMIWAPGLSGEDITDYHIDSLARFTGPGRVLMNLQSYPEAGDPFHEAAVQTRSALKNAGLEVDVISEPANPRVKSYDFVASYVNYYVCNGGVVAAEFGDHKTDEQARIALQRHYPEREIVSLNVDPLGEFGGGIHCATQQLPAR